MNNSAFEEYQINKNKYNELKQQVVQNKIKHYTDMYFGIYNTITWKKNHLFVKKDPKYAHLIEHCKQFEPFSLKLCNPEEINNNSNFNFNNIHNNSNNNSNNNNNLSINECCRLKSKSLNAAKSVPKKLVREFDAHKFFFTNDVKVYVENIYDDESCFSANNIYYSFNNKIDNKLTVLFAFSFGDGLHCFKNKIDDKNIKIYIDDIIELLISDENDIILTGHSFGSYIVLRILEHIIEQKLSKKTLNNLFIVCSGLPNYNIDVDLYKINNYFATNGLLNHIIFYLTIFCQDNVCYYDQILSDIYFNTINSKNNNSKNNNNKNNNNKNNNNNNNKNKKNNGSDKFELLNTTLLCYPSYDMSKITKFISRDNPSLHAFNNYKHIYLELNSRSYTEL